MFTELCKFILHRYKISAPSYATSHGEDSCRAEPPVFCRVTFSQGDFVSRNLCYSLANASPCSLCWDGAAAARKPDCSQQWCYRSLLPPSVTPAALMNKGFVPALTLRWERCAAGVWRCDKPSLVLAPSTPFAEEMLSARCPCTTPPRSAAMLCGHALRPRSPGNSIHQEFIYDDSHGC